VGGAPYTVVAKLEWYWRLNEADLSGRLTREGIQIEDEPLCTALDLIYSLWLDDITPLGESRASVRAKVDRVLARPVDSREVEEYDRRLAVEEFEREAREAAMRMEGQ
jgi:hypothetical protein